MCFVGLSVLVVSFGSFLDYAWMHLNPGVKRYARDILMHIGI
jgi:hypothetical protein